MSGGCDVTAHHYRENCQFPPCGHLAGWYAIYQTCPPYLTPWGAEVRAIWHINRASVLHMIYQVLVTLRLTVYGENSPVSAAFRRRPFRRLICHITNLHTILKLLLWRHSHVTYVYICHQDGSARYPWFIQLECAFFTLDSKYLESCVDNTMQPQSLRRTYCRKNCQIKNKPLVDRKQNGSA